VQNFAVISIWHGYLHELHDYTIAPNLLQPEVAETAWISQNRILSREFTRVCGNGLIFRVNSRGFAATMDDR
jgi:hypothetical protein